MKAVTSLLAIAIVVIFSVATAQANSLCSGQEGNWLVAPAKDPNFGNYFLGGLCDNNACYHVTVSNDPEGNEMEGLAFTCDEIGNGTNRILWVFVDVHTGEKQEVQATLTELNAMLRQALSE